MFTPEPQSISEWIEGLRRFAKLHNLSNSRFAELAGLNKNSLGDFKKDSWNPTAETLRKMDKARKDWLEQ